MRFPEISEFDFIRRIAPLGIIRSQGVVKGIGDDCAVIEHSATDYLLITTDLLAEGIHFKTDWITPEELGAKALAVNISDIAACGGAPRDVVVSLAVPTHMSIDFLERLYVGMSKMAQRFQVNILGGDTSASQRDLFVNVTATGLVNRSRLLLRSGANPGDLVVISGLTGLSAAGLFALRKGVGRGAGEGPVSSLIQAHSAPLPHVYAGQCLANHGCSAAIDVSDGLVADLAHICSQSGVGAIVCESAVPIAPALSVFAASVGVNPLNWALYGGEDYVLLAALSKDDLVSVRESCAELEQAIYVIGHFTDEPGVRLMASNGKIRLPSFSGWDHFATGRRTS